MGKEGFAPSFLCAREPPAGEFVVGTRRLWQSQRVGLWEDTSRLGQVAFALLTDLFLVMKVVGRFLSHWEVAVGWGQPVFTYTPPQQGNLHLITSPSLGHLVGSLSPKGSRNSERTYLDIIMCFIRFPFLGDFQAQS